MNFIRSMERKYDEVILRLPNGDVISNKYNNTISNSILKREKEKMSENALVEKPQNLIIETNDFEVVMKNVEKELKPFNLIVTLENEVEARKDRAEINKIKSKYNRERLDINKGVNAAYKIIDELITKKLTEYDEALEKVENERKEIQKQEIVAYYETLKAEIELDEIFDERWLNKSIDWKGEIAKALIEHRAAEVDEDEDAVDFILGDKPRTVEAVEITTLRLKNASPEQVTMVTKLLKQLNVEFTIE